MTFVRCSSRAVWCNQKMPVETAGEVDYGNLIVVSNRLPFVLKRNEKTGKLERSASAGGLVTAVAPVVIRSKGVWVGWPGMHLNSATEPIPESDPSDTTPTAGLLSEQVVAVQVNPEIFNSYYNGCCNGTFWPLFHSLPDKALHIAENWRAYTQVNKEFAEKTMEALRLMSERNPSSTPLVWVHDYHLMLAANTIRQQAEETNIQCKLGFFLHIPFPPWDIFRLFPWDDEVLQGMLGCDMVGFHIKDYCLNFVDCCQRRLGCRVDRHSLLVEHGGRTVRVRPLPIGIPFDRFVQLAEAAPEMRMNHLRRRERQHDVNFWMKSFFKAMGTLIVEDGEDVLPTTIAPVNMMDFDETLTDYIGSTSKLVLLLDYDGTLAPIAAHPDLAILPRETKEVLKRLSNMSDVYIAIISGRSVSNVREMVGIDNITYAGSHGLEIEHPDGTKFVHPMPVEIEGKVSQLIKNLQEEVCHDGAWVENKGALLTYHYRETPNLLRPDMVEKARKLIIDAGFHAGIAHCALEARPPVQWNKGRASLYILRTAFGLDWSERVRIIYAGDDVTDEDAMLALKGMAITYRVTASHSVRTAANRRLPSTDSIFTMLKWVEQHMSRRQVKENSSPVRSPVGEPMKVEVKFE
ncbi:hypothetical protein B566_EDAN002298 [Ephemera danica]|nr:hypothetical protein B566_EDAN002298 [Ephemera danica]